jgi:3-oxoacyl-[acyl-carrier-protein] synthase-3
MRCNRSVATAVEVEDDSGNVRSADNLFMNGAEIFSFTLSAVPKSIEMLLHKSGKKLEDIDLFVFHQANRYMLEHLRKRMKISEAKFHLAMNHCGNTVSCSIPIALKHALIEGKVLEGSLLMLVGFGVGYSWGATLVRWTKSSGGTGILPA